MHTRRSLSFIAAGAPVALFAVLAVFSHTALGAQKLAGAARAGDEKQALELIESGADVNAASSDGTTPLLWSTFNSNLQISQALLKAGANVDAANRYGITPLLQASRTGDAPMIKLLLDSGANPNLAHPKGETPLMAAARTGRVDAINLLLAKGAHVNAADSYQNQTALMWAAAEGHLDAVDVLLKAGADPNKQARVSTLTDRSINADFPTGGFTPLMWAVRNGDEAVARRLIQGGADLNLKNGDQATATMIAIVNDRFDLAATLLDLGAGVDDGSLYYAVEMRDATTDWFAHDGSRERADHPNRNTALDLIKLLLDKGADPNKPFVGQLHNYSMCCDIFANATPFYRAAVASDVEAMKLLLAKGADLSWMPSKVEGPGAMGANTNVGKPALTVAMNGGRGVSRSGGPGDLRQGPPPFREPSNRSQADAVKLLIAAGADVTATLPDGSTVMHEAVKSRRPDVIRVVAAAGAPLTKPNKAGKTPLDLAGQPLKYPPGAPIPEGEEEKATPEQVVALLKELIAAQPAEAQANNQ
ncbi:MAG TPA: ankyrin repeat domain-containing protein [Gammaproteobacteria bacterium]|nr:ankyrin repeat domain-containing protein [Gammaproteobacteria bacterium]